MIPEIMKTRCINKSRHTANYNLPRLLSLIIWIYIPCIKEDGPLSALCQYQFFKRAISNTLMSLNITCCETFTSEESCFAPQEGSWACKAGTQGGECDDEAHGLLDKEHTSGTSHAKRCRKLYHNAPCVPQLMLLRSSQQIQHHFPVGKKENTEPQQSHITSKTKTFASILNEITSLDLSFSSMGPSTRSWSPKISH